MIGITGGQDSPDEGTQRHFSKPYPPPLTEIALVNLGNPSLLSLLPFLTHSSL